MESITDRINILLKNRGITPYRLCEDTGIDSGTFSKSSKTKNRWKSQHLITMAEYFRVSLDWLMMGEKPKKESPGGSLSQAAKKIKRIPVLGLAECGRASTTWFDRAERVIEMTDVGQFNKPFILVAKGESMRPYINPGDKLLCAEIPEQIKNGTAVVVSFHSAPDSYEANAKLIKFLKDDRVMLYSVNTKFPPTIHKEGEIHKIFKLVRIIRDVK
jgi:SOS-response transcriptional repressor LexA